MNLTFWLGFFPQFANQGPDMKASRWRSTRIHRDYLCVQG